MFDKYDKAALLAVSIWFVLAVSDWNAWLITIIALILLTSALMWVFIDQKRSAHFKASFRARPPARLKYEVDSLSAIEPGKSHEFFEEVDRLKDKCHSYPILLLELKRKERNAKVALLTLKHQSTLQRNLRKAVKKDDYGTVLSDDSTSEIMRFLESMGYAYDEKESPKDLVIVQNVVKEIRNAEHQQGFDVTDVPEGGIDFEHWVSNQLSKFGWDTAVTQPGSDQGIDIIARYGDTNVGIQCKRYTANVGNKAVQEAFSAKRFFKLDRVIVITTSNYTKSARELAQNNDVGLHAVDDIPNLVSLLEIH